MTNTSYTVNTIYPMEDNRDLSQPPQHHSACISYNKPYLHPDPPNFLYHIRENHESQHLPEPLLPRGHIVGHLEQHLLVRSGIYPFVAPP